MTWTTRRVTRPIVVGVEQRSMIDTTWVRREITEPEDPWNEVRLTGLFDLGSDAGGVEACLTPTSFGPTMTATAESLTADYRLKEHTDDLAARLDDLLRRAASL